MEQAKIIRRTIIQQPLPLSYHPQTPNKTPYQQVPSWLLSRYLDESYVQISILPENKDKHLRLWFRIIKKLGFIYPESTLLLYWNLLMVISMVLNYYEIPVAMFFTSAVYYTQFKSGISLALNTLFTTCIFINIVFIRPLTAYYHSGRLVTTRKLIFNRYLKFQFGLNVISWISLMVYIFANNPNLIYVKLLFYLSVVSLYRIDRLILYKVEIWRVASALYKLLRLLCMLLFILFWIASIFFAIDYNFYLQKNQYYPVNLWLSNTVACQYGDQSYIDLVQLYTWPVWLNYSMYWELQTVSGVGYGDMTPRNPVEVAFCDVVIVIFCLFYAVFVNSIWQILLDLLGKQRNYQKKILKYYERNYNLDRQMMVKLQNYIYERTQAQQKQQKQKHINQNLSAQLKNQLLLARQKKLFIGISFFNQLTQALSEEYAEFLYSLASCTKDMMYGQGEIIFSTGDRDARLYLLALGEVKLTYQNTKFVRFIKNQDKNNFFGVADFACRGPSNFSAHAEKYSKISELTQQQFLNSIKQNHKIHQKCQQLYQNIQLYNDYELTSQTCWICDTNNYHATHKCPQYFEWLTIYRDPIKQKLVQRAGYTFRNFRYRKSSQSKKIYVNKNRLFKYQQVQPDLLSGSQQDKNMPQFPDHLKSRNKNTVDEFKNFSSYRIQFKL